ncbi:ribonuclease T2-like [Solea solea]|uniref:ribonuclease T2-like n=1 Tax=Solea solea TaxID=90069 RepID=UPI0027297251|nr:ribonuclease T2-like [Solea solea]
MRSPVLPLLLSFFLLQVLVSATHWEDYKYGHQDLEPHNKTSYCTWKCLLFTLQWPGGFCQSLNNKTACRIPQSISNWTIHGLWPVRAKHCCSCWPMFHSDVQELEAELNEQWPSFVKTKSSFHFWRDEWKKHGVCAGCVEGMNSPHRYFQICLKLRGRFNIYKILEDGGIVPSCERPYKVEEVQSILAPHLGKIHEIQCVTDSKEREVWFQVKVPLAQNLTLGCHDDTEKDHGTGAGASPGWIPSPGHPCPPQLPFYYFPINYKQPQQPCD